MAINELFLQSKVVESIRELGGFAQKCSNRFLIGVPDILCQLPGFSTSYWEVKKSPHKKWMCPDLSPKQKIWLRDFTKAGGFGGVIYFCNDGNDLAVGIKPVSYFGDVSDIKKKWRIDENDFVVLPRGCKMKPFREEILRVHSFFRKWNFIL